MDESREKVRKLRRYGRKDYTQLVDFPVEIVGRDGVVRQYSFDESLRLYQRRVASAALRYTDAELISAEQGHCRRRIEQLRKSYLARYGWSAIRLVDSPGLLAGEFAGELAAFLRRVTELDDVAPDDLEFAFVEDGEDHQLYYVRVREVSREGDSEPWLLYLYRFVRTGSCPGRDAFFGFLKVLQGVQRGLGAVERLMAFHHTGDCGLILTGRGASATDAGVSDELAWLALGEARQDPLRDGMAALRRGKQEHALELFTRAYEQQPFRRPAYVGAVVVADRLGAFAVGETAALMGTAYFPEDPVLNYHLALGQIRQGAVAEAEDSLAILDTVGVAGPATQVLRALLDLRHGRLWQGARRLLAQRRVLRAEGLEDDQDLASAVALLLGQLRVMVLICTAGLVAATASALALGTSPVWALGIVLGIAAVPAAFRSWRRGFEAILQVPGAWGLQLANPTAIRRAGSPSGRGG